MKKGWREPEHWQRRGANVKEEDRLKACKSLQEIETDLTYLLIESYQRREIDDVRDILELMRPFLDVHKEICGQHTK